jgi:hypothetical protein
MRFFSLIVVLACTMAAGSDQRAALSGGKMVGDNGVDIDYVTGPFVGGRAADYAHQNPKTRLTVIKSAATGEIQVALHSEHDYLVVSIENSDFTARNVRTRNDVVDVLLMASTVVRLTK